MKCLWEEVARQERVLTSSGLLCPRKQLKELEEAGMLRGQLSSAQQLALLSSHDDLAEALEGAFFVQVTRRPLPSPAPLCDHYALRKVWPS